MSLHSKIAPAAINIYRDITKCPTCYGFFINFSQPGQDINIQDETVYLQVDRSENVSALLKGAENDLSASSGLLYQADVCFMMLTGPKQAILIKRYMETNIHFSHYLHIFIFLTIMFNEGGGVLSNYVHCKIDN